MALCRYTYYNIYTHGNMCMCKIITVVVMMLGLDFVANLYIVSVLLLLSSFIMKLHV